MLGHCTVYWGLTVQMRGRIWVERAGRESWAAGQPGLSPWAVFLGHLVLTGWSRKSLLSHYKTDGFRPKPCRACVWVLPVEPVSSAVAGCQAGNSRVCALQRTRQTGFPCDSRAARAILGRTGLQSAKEPGRASQEQREEKSSQNAAGHAPEDWRNPHLDTLVGHLLRGLEICCGVGGHTTRLGSRLGGDLGALASGGATFGNIWTRGLLQGITRSELLFFLLSRRLFQARAGTLTLLPRVAGKDGKAPSTG